MAAFVNIEMKVKSSGRGVATLGREMVKSEIVLMI
jgi:hypothetical protein